MWDTCWGNAPGESIWSSVKRERLIGRRRTDSNEQAVVTVAHWIETYNTIRPHSTLGTLAPVNYKKSYSGFPEGLPIMLEPSGPNFAPPSTIGG